MCLTTARFLRQYGQLLFLLLYRGQPIMKDTFQKIRCFFSVYPYYFTPEIVILKIPLFDCLKVLIPVTSKYFVKTESGILIGFSFLISIFLNPGCLMIFT